MPKPTLTPTEMVEHGLKHNQYPKMLYKYRKHNDNTEKIIKDSQLWFSPPSEFNDPYDCNTPIISSTSLDEFKTWYYNVGLPIPMTLVDAHDRIESLKEKISEIVHEAINMNLICCFSTLYNSILQWSHYSEYHKGICFGFDVKSDVEFFTKPIIVAYRQVMQHYNHFLDKTAVVEYIIKPKFHDWSYESEVRIVKTDKQIADNGGNQGFTFKNAALSEVIFGTNTPDKIIDLYITLCMNNHKSHVRFYKMKLGSGSHYELERRTVNVINTGGIYTHQLI